MKLFDVIISEWQYESGGFFNPTAVKKFKTPDKVVTLNPTQIVSMCSTRYDDGVYTAIRTTIPNTTWFSPESFDVVRKKWEESL